MFSDDKGMSGWAAYQLGRMAADGDHQRRRTVRALLSPPPIDVHAVMANNQALAAQNQALWNQVDDFQRSNAELANNYNNLLENYKRLEVWADGTTDKLREMGVTIINT